MKNFFIKILILFCTHSLFGQDCTSEKLSKHWKLRVNLSTFVAQKEGVDIDPKFINYDFMNLPIGVPFNYLDYVQLDQYNYVNIGDDKLISPAFEAYKKMKIAANKNNAVINIKSSYRNKSTQTYMLNKHGAHQAETPGYSEHHLLTTIDIRYCGENTKLFLWMLNHAHEYGWIPSYYFRKGTQIRREAWHWRYVGIEAAQWFRCTWNTEYSNEIYRLNRI
ncbi:D-alanyl-D-alanine carboxypeptidase family protein [Flammeovirga yaeyamensis]|uniref:D-alanyl-D-alanine carboxypeptidase family protein n=1 Tax=Flammeovirga yaeyamensis TaxID=367791 RepID=A0AAX1N3C9_9BACT|nr:D-alanyl-D-alanine carboxypeptidase family protein [Flammeovirga yaeyamensis]MBB3696059.1 LAS superfamily LD-carboxypeptidase LdcB [Flammeovirga yaeyamensis]NMF34744.1 M15 family metallopeptidase [Flammeovirga yaeyamensis]QWG00428.1 D-alanyl-D-alanine carboxypeptidase family protein [Flammeovirga yaeyamensis]